MIKTRVLFLLLLAFSVMTPAVAEVKSWYQLNNSLKESAGYNSLLTRLNADYVKAANSVQRSRILPLERQLASCKRAGAGDCAEISAKLKKARALRDFYSRHHVIMREAERVVIPLGVKLEQCANKYVKLHKIWRSEVDKCSDRRSIAYNCTQESKENDWDSYNDLKSVKKECKRSMKTWLKTATKYTLHEMRSVPASDLR